MGLVLRYSAVVLRYWQYGMTFVLTYRPIVVGHRYQ